MTRRWTKSSQMQIRSFSVAPPPPPSFAEAILFAPPDARAIFSHNDLPCNDTCSVNGGAHNVLGGHKRKSSENCMKTTNRLVDIEKFKKDALVKN